MSLENQVASLTAATTNLLEAVNVSKATLDQRVTDAAAQATASTQQATAAAASAAAANTSAGQSAGSASQALAIFGSTAAQQAAVVAAQNSASVAAGHAASASSVVQQDLSGVNAAALHRSPNAVTAMFIYDTSKDSDGGAWTEKCQHTSWYNEPISGKWLGPQASEAAARAVSGATTGDYFQRTSDGLFYSLNATSGITQTFRGNKRDFPRLAAIVAENNGVTIYDLTEPGRPMWMRFVGSSSYGGALMRVTSGATGNALACLNGTLCVTSARDDGGLVAVSLPTDSARYFTQASFSARRAKFEYIARRNTQGLWQDGVTDLPSIASFFTNAVAMTVLPNAPIDPVTGLRVPTIAVHTAGGVSIIRHDGTVTSSAFSGGTGDGVAFVQPDLLAYTRFANFWGFQSVRVSEIVGPTFSPSFAGGNTATQGLGPVNLRGIRRGTFVSNRSAATGTAITLAKTGDTVTPGGLLRADVANAFNTGYLFGDIRRAYLADVGAGSVGPAPELVTNGTFSAGATGWNLSAWTSVASEALVFDGTTSIGNGSVLATNSPASPVVPGKVYQVVYTINGGTGTGISVNVGGALGAIRIGAGTYSEVLTAINNGAPTVLARGSDGIRTGSIDNISVKEVVADRSYKAQSANITGTLTKTPVAEGAQLVAWSNWSAVNNVQEPYSADLDFGTGEWTCSAWINSASGPRHNLLTETEFRNGVTDAPTRVGLVSASTLAGYAGAIAFGYDGSTSSSAYKTPAYVAGVAYTHSVVVRMDDGNAPVFGNPGSPASSLNDFAFSNQGVVAAPTFVNDLGSGFYRVGFTATPGGGSNLFGLIKYASHSNRTFKVTAYDLRVAAAPPGYQRVDAGTEEFVGTLADRSAATGPRIALQMVNFGLLRAVAFDGTTTRTVTTTQTYNTGSWLKARANYRAGRLSIQVNGQEVAVTNGAPLLTLNNSNAVLTIGNSFALDAPFPGSIALVKFSAGVPTAEQSLFMYEQEKQMFREGAQVCLPDAGSLVDLTYDDATDKWIAISATNESEFSGLVRTSVTPVPAGSYIKATATSGVQLLARSTTTPGVDLTMPAYGLRSELVKRAEAAAKMKQDTLVFDFDTIGFTAAMTTGSNQITASSITGTPFVGMVVTGTGIPANTTIAGINGTTYTLSANATATGSNAVGQAGFDLPTGYTARVVYSAGAQRREGSTRDYTRLFDGFREQIRFAVTPGGATWVQIHAVKEIA